MQFPTFFPNQNLLHSVSVYVLIIFPVPQSIPLTSSFSVLSSFHPPSSPQSMPLYFLFLFFFQSLYFTGWFTFPLFPNHPTAQTGSFYFPLFFPPPQPTDWFTTGFLNDILSFTCDIGADDD